MTSTAHEPKISSGLGTSPKLSSPTKHRDSSFSRALFCVCHPDRSAALLCPSKRISGAEWRDPEDFDSTMPIQGVLPRLHVLSFLGFSRCRYQGTPSRRAERFE
jgi:hypothetical protein